MKGRLRGVNSDPDTGLLAPQLDPLEEKANLLLTVRLERPMAEEFQKYCRSYQHRSKGEVVRAMIEHYLSIDKNWQSWKANGAKP